MSRYLILAQSKMAADALANWGEILWPNEREVGLVSTTARIVAPEFHDDTAGVESYFYLADSIEQALENNHDICDPQRICILVDCIAPTSLSLVSESLSWTHLIALLILTFPEVRWIFAVVEGQAAGFPWKDHALNSDVIDVWRDPLLDPTGLRNWIRVRTNQALKLEAVNFQLPVRSYKAAAIDDELNYCYFHGYTAYRFGYLTDVVCSWALMSRLFSSRDSTAPDTGHGYRILLEDMSLNFADKPNAQHILHLENRAVALSLLNSKNAALENSALRMLITSGYDSHDRTALEANQIYLKHKAMGIGRPILKPAGGILDLWQEIGQMGPGLDNERLGNACGFAWPPFTETVSYVAGHGAPGKLILLAERLVRRAENLKTRATSLTQFVLGAVIAGEAAELVGGRAPMLSLTALTLKHEFEVKMECAFVGVGFHFEVGKRAREIEEECRAVCESFAGKARARSQLNAQAVILNRLARVFREEARYEEETNCLVAVREKNRMLQRVQERDWLQLALSVTLGYAEWLLVSFKRFVCIVALWLLISTAGWFFFGRIAKPDIELMAVISSVFSAFFGGNAVNDSNLLVVWSCLTVVFGAFHMGILISFIYSLTSRK